MARDDFSTSIKDRLAKRVAYSCSNPACRALTVGPHTDSHKSVSVGVAAHITAASPGGPRFDAALSESERTSIENAIWLCQTCGKLIDSDPARYPVELLRAWKIDSESRVRSQLESHDRGNDSQTLYPQAPGARHLPIPRIAGLPYGRARGLLVQAGWQPLINHWSYADELKHGNGQYFWDRGFHEIIHSSGTGMGHCAFGFEDAYGSKLTVITAGEEIPETGSQARVSNWYFNES